jgi:hypothetical protein
VERTYRTVGGPTSLPVRRNLLELINISASCSFLVIQNNAQNANA